MLELIGPKIKEAREEINMSQKDLGMALGLSDKAVSAYEAARTIPPLETLVRIADELHKPLDYFINRNSPDYTVETKLSVMEQRVAKMTEELKAISEQALERIEAQQHNKNPEYGPEAGTPKNLNAPETNSDKETEPSPLDNTTPPRPSPVPY